MNKQALLFGIAGLFIGALLTGIVMANRTVDTNTSQSSNNKMEGMSMERENSDKVMTMSGDAMMETLQGKTGEEFDKAFITAMIEHHSSAISMAEEAKKNAGRDEIKTLADDIITAQTSEINQMKMWQKDWGFTQ